MQVVVPWFNGTVLVSEINPHITKVEVLINKSDIQSIMEIVFYNKMYSTIAYSFI